MRKYRFVVILLIVSFMFGAYTFFIQRQQKQSANERLCYSLREAASCFAIDYTKLDDESKTDYYMKAAANLHTAIYILPYTSYSNIKNSNKELTAALSGLYMSITVQSTPNAANRWKAFTEKRREIYEALHYISENPNDKNNCGKIAKIAQEIGY